MGPRPKDFDEKLVKRSPTYQKWVKLKPGEAIKYACREFIKGRGEDEERLMRRIMIARRSNIRDHEKLIKARQLFDKNNTPFETAQLPEPKAETKPDVTNEAENKEDFCNDRKRKNRRGRKRKERPNEEKSDSHNDNIKRHGDDLVSSSKRIRKATTLVSDEQVRIEMDVEAVVATRSYRAWLKLEDGEHLLYNKTYTKGEKDHDWLLRKNIWRRMKYRRDNKRLLQKMVAEGSNHNGERETAQKLSTLPASGSSIIAFTSRKDRDVGPKEAPVSTASEIVDHALSSTDSAMVVSSDTVTAAINDKMDTDERQNTNENALTSTIGDHHNLVAVAAGSIAMVGTGVVAGVHDEDSTNAIEAAVAAAESYAKIEITTTEAVPDAAMSTSVNETSFASSPAATTPFDDKALDVAARLAAATAAVMLDNENVNTSDIKQIEI